MRRIIHRLRSHPEHVRVKMLYVATLASAAVLFSAWVFSIGYSGIADEDVQASIKEDLKPFQMLKASVVDGTKNLSWPLSKSDFENTDTTNSSGVVVDQEKLDAMNASTDADIEEESEVNFIIQENTNNTDYTNVE